MMKKLNMVILFSVLASTFSLAQGTLAKGGKQFNAGLGFSDWGVPIYAGLDFGVHESITIGPRISFRNYSYTNSGYKYKQSLTVLSFNGNYHFNKLLALPRPWDLYAGLTLGYYFWSDVKSSSGVYYEGESSTTGLDLQIGGRYFFSNDFGINLEVGGGTEAGGRFGITYKF
jgi:outer membrane immunogenic protein